jgi:hypothetical protein
LLDLLKPRQYGDRSGRLGAQAVVALAHKLILPDGLPVLVQPLVGAAAGKGEDLQVGAGVFALVVLQAREGRLVDVGAGHVLRDGKAVRVFPGQALKLGHHLEQIRLGDVLGVASALVLPVVQAGNPVARAG